MSVSESRKRDMNLNIKYNHINFIIIQYSLEIYENIIRFNKFIIPNIISSGNSTLFDFILYTILYYTL